MTFYETERLTLRLMNSSDAEFIYHLYNCPNFIKYIGDRNIRSVEDAQLYIEQKFLPQIEQLGYGNYLITKKENGKKIGGAGIFHRDFTDVPDIGFSFLEEEENKGYGYEAAKCLLDAAFQDFGLLKISAFTTKENIPSQKLIEKLGLVYKKNIFVPGDEEALLYYETV